MSPRDHGRADDWPERESGWRRKLRRIRFGAEPIEEQLARLRRVTIALTAVPSAIGLIFLGIFAGFGRPDVGAVVVGILLVPVVALAWLDDLLLRARVAAYLKERASHFPDDSPPA